MRRHKSVPASFITINGVSSTIPVRPNASRCSLIPTKTILRLSRYPHPSNAHFSTKRSSPSSWQSIAQHKRTPSAQAWSLLPDNTSANQRFSMNYAHSIAISAPVTDLYALLAVLIQTSELWTCKQTDVILSQAMVTTEAPQLREDAKILLVYPAFIPTKYVLPAKWFRLDINI